MAGYRVFPDEAVDRLRFIRRAQAFGFTLEEIRELLGIRVYERSSCEQVRARATCKLADVEARIALNRIRRVPGPGGLSRVRNAPSDGPVPDPGEPRGAGWAPRKEEAVIQVQLIMILTVPRLRRRARTCEAMLCGGLAPR
jgi:DNA-binding transcriptional MerR regulator